MVSKFISTLRGSSMRRGIIGGTRHESSAHHRCPDCSMHLYADGLFLPFCRRSAGSRRDPFPSDGRFVLHREQGRAGRRLGRRYCSSARRLGAPVGTGESNRTEQLGSGGCSHVSFTVLCRRTRLIDLGLLHHGKVPTVYGHGTAIRTLVAGPGADSRTKVVVRGIRHRCMVVVVAVAETDHTGPDPSAPSSPSALSLLPIRPSHSSRGCAADPHRFRARLPCCRPAAAAAAR